MSIPFELLYKRIRELNIRTKDWRNFRRITLDMYLDKGLVVVHRKPNRVPDVKWLRVRQRREIGDEVEFDKLLKEYEPLEVVQDMRFCRRSYDRQHTLGPETILLKPWSDRDGTHYNIDFKKGHAYVPFKKWFFSKEEKEARRLIKSIHKKEGSSTTGQRLKIIKDCARYFSQNYDEMLGILRCIDELYTVVTDRGYHDPSYSRTGKGSVVQRRFELPCINALFHAWYHNMVTDDGDLRQLAFDMFFCRKEYDGFTLEEDMLVPSKTEDPLLFIGGQLNRSKVDNRLLIGRVYDKPHSWDYLCARIVPLQKN